MNFSISVKDAKDLSFTTREEAINTVIRLMEERDEVAAELRSLSAINAELVQALERISKQPDWFKSQSIAKVVLKKAKQ